MKLRKIELNNFRQFYGEQSITFSTHPQKNVTLIHAENGTGKTALLNAILWCFFETTTKNFKDPKALLNKVAKLENKKNYGVKIEFVDDKNQVFLAQRNFSSDGLKFKIFKLDGNSYEEISNPNSFINSVIPKDMSKYFFFQGEGIGKVSGSKGDSVVKKAVREILGFTIAELALTDIKNLKREYQRSLSNADRSGTVAKLQNEIADLEEAINSNTKRLKECQTAISLYNEKLKNIDSTLQNSDSAVIKQIHETRKESESRLHREKDLLARAESDKKRLVGEFATTVFGFNLSKQAMDFIDESEYKGTVPAPYNEQLVQDILKEASCICGAIIKPGTDAYQRVTEMLKKATDPRLESRIKKARAQLTAIKNDSRKAKDRFVANLTAISDSENNIRRLQKKLEELSVKIKGAESLDSIKKLEEERQRASANLTQSERTYGACTNNIERDKKELERKRSELRRMDSFTSEMTKYRNLVDYTQKVEEVIETTLAQSEKDVELQIIQKVNKYLKKFVRQDYSAKLNKNTFDIRLVDKNDSIVPESDGQSLLLNLTFISSLIELSRERKGASGQILTPGAIAPFVVDAPFGDLDKTYKGHVAKAIPESVEQVILLLSSTHWEGTVESSIRSKVGCEYNMVLEVSSAADGKQEDAINIHGTEYATVRYEQSVERTVLEKVGEYVECV